MKRALWVVLFAPLLPAGVVPNRYIVELSTEPVAEHLVRQNGSRLGAHAALRSAEAQQQRLRVRAEQQAARAGIEQQAGRVLEQVDTVSNALVVNIPDANAGRLAAIAGVRKVYPDRRFKLNLDHALPLHKVPDAWSQVGFGNAGAGSKIGFIDTGIDSGHAAFQDSSLSAPAGFPRVTDDADMKYTSGKIIVARSYAALFNSIDPDPSPRDHIGHGTATAMCAAGVTNAGPLATITGVAPKAYIGVYKVFGTPGVNDDTSDSVLLKAIDDAVADGMDVINISLGGIPTTRFADDPEVQALERAASLGVVVVASVGNDGPDPGTISSPAMAPSVIAVGSSTNDRQFTSHVVLGDGTPMIGIPGNGPSPQDPITAPMVDVTTVDTTGLGCAALPANSLGGAVVLILRGTCNFEDKLNNAQAAGAVGAVIYTDAARPDAIPMDVGAATLPAEMVSNADGVAIKAKLKNAISVTLRFALEASYVDPAKLADFSAQGPNVDLSIKPDLVAAGTNLYMATQKLDTFGEMYGADGYTLEQGTSFSSPIVAGAAGLLKAARPGLTAVEYRSLLVDTASPAYLVPGTPASVQQVGGGLLNLSAALNATAAASPVSVSFGSGTAGGTVTRSLTISNVGTAPDSYTLSVQPTGGGPAPSLDQTAVSLGAGASAPVTLSITATGTPGQYQGFIAIQGANASVPTRVPYWFAVPSGIARHVTVTYIDSPSPNSFISEGILFKVTDENGLPVPSPDTKVSVISGTATQLAVRSLDRLYPNTWSVDFRTGRAGLVGIRIQVGDVTQDVPVIVQ